MAPEPVLSEQLRLLPVTGNFWQLQQQIDATAVTEPLDFAALATPRLLKSSRDVSSWVFTPQEMLQLPAGDPYQPGRPMSLPDLLGLNRAELRLLRMELLNYSTGAPLAANNLTPRAIENGLLRPERHNWFQRNQLRMNVPIGERFALIASKTGQWAEQTIPIRPENLGTRMLIGYLRGEYQTTRFGRFDGMFHGSKADLSGMGLPYGVETFHARRMAQPILPSPYLRETNRMDFFQAGWRLDTIWARYQYSTANLDTLPNVAAIRPARIDLLTGIADGPALSNMAVRTRHAFRIHGGHPQGARRRIEAGFSYWTADATNHWGVPGGRQILTLAGAPVSILQTGEHSRNHVRVSNLVAEFRHSWQVSRWLRAEQGVSIDHSQGGPVSWTNILPQAGIALTPIRRLTIRGSYQRQVLPMAGRFAEFGDPAAPSGLEFSPEGTLLRRFGGRYSSVLGGIQRPFRDVFQAVAFADLPYGIFAEIRGFRGDDRRRLLASNVGVTDADFRPREIFRPIFEDYITVFDQTPESLGRDRFLLAHSRERTLNAGYTLRAGIRHGASFVAASFTAEKSFGTTNPGNGVLENDPLVLGALGMDPNTWINASGRAFFDRAYIGRIHGWTTWKGFEIGAAIQYFDGLAFGQRLLVQGMTQGPLVVHSTVRGSPEGGHRTEYVGTLDVRVARPVEVRGVVLRFVADVFNVTNSAKQLVECDIMDADFERRMPLMLQPPRIVRFGIELRY
jgi:hypothetical protein